MNINQHAFVCELLRHGKKYEAELLTVQRKRELLAQIAEGKWMEQPPPDHIEGQRVPVMVPTLKERLKAIDMDNRMDGSYRAATQPGELSAVPAVQNETERNPPAPQ